VGGGWRNSYFGYTFTTIVLFAVIAGIRGAAISAGTLAAVALVRDPSGGVPSLQSFLTSSWDMRAGAAEFYVFAGAILATLKSLFDHARRLSAVAVEDARQRAAADAKAQVALDLHDGIKQMVNAMLLRMTPLVRAQQANRDETAEELRWLWTGMSYLKSEFEQVMHALARPSSAPEEEAQCELVSVVQEEVNTVHVMTGFRWRLSADPPHIRVALTAPLALRRFLREAFMNAWKHSGEETGSVDVRRTAEAAIVTISDAGRGFEYPVGSTSQTTGIHSLHSRSRELGAKLELDTGLGRGCKVVLTLPVQGFGHF
jgi:signal transduction histidine kinase